MKLKPSALEEARVLLADGKSMTLRRLAYLTNRNYTSFNLFIASGDLVVVGREPPQQVPGLPQFNRAGQPILALREFAESKYGVTPRKPSMNPRVRELVNKKKAS